MQWRRVALTGGVVGPAGFISAWVLGGARTEGYSPVDDAISRLAAVDAPTRGLMTAGFVCFGVAVPAFAWAAREQLGARAATALAIAGVTTLGVALTPLDHSDAVDKLHGVFAASGYVALAATPLLARSSVRARGWDRLARTAPIVSTVSAVCLAATVAGPAHGFFQRAGLTTTDAWVMAAALACLR